MNNSVFDNESDCKIGNKKARHFANEEKSDVLLALNRELELRYDSITSLEKFNKSLQWVENFYLYLLKYREAGPALKDFNDGLKAKDNIWTDNAKEKYHGNK